MWRNRYNRRCHRSSHRRMVGTGRRHRRRPIRAQLGPLGSLLGSEGVVARVSG
ncbi:hypothetical protein SCOCK_510022 [Actinacidiphila cocklensis]|uniref:Uncharacterized protein n=1 Tax=Actinacidiphila cocklensis TaxID=887465 RepID=A0A9W4GUG5_9ACTN|nr:hypothetical protein SCOCK_510022 [Actinacidiphila cocklensis]